MEDLPNEAIAYLQANPLIAGAVGLVLLYLLLRQTKTFIFLLVLVAVLGAVFFLIMDLAGKGGASKHRMIQQTGSQDAR